MGVVHTYLPTDLMQCVLFDGFRGCRTKLSGAVNHIDAFKSKEPAKLGNRCMSLKVVHVYKTGKAIGVLPSYRCRLRYSLRSRGQCFLSSSSIVSHLSRLV